MGKGVFLISEFETYSELHHSQTYLSSIPAAGGFETYSELHHSQTIPIGLAGDSGLRPIQNYITLKLASRCARWHSV